VSCGCGGGCAAGACGSTANVQQSMPGTPCNPLGSYQQTLAARLAKRADKLRVKYQQFGLRPYLVWMVWTRWGGEERGEGVEREQRRVQILPAPKVQDLTAISLQPQSGGLLPVGSVRISSVTTTLSLNMLLGRQLPGMQFFDACGLPQMIGAGTPVALVGRTQEEQMFINAGIQKVNTNRIPETYEFFYEITNAAIPDSPRYKFRLFNTPFLNAEKFGWEFVLERISEDRNAAGESQIGTDHE
jgi:hypothetical protein